MPITVNEGGVKYELGTVYANEGGVKYELDTIHANEGGTKYEIHSAYKDPNPVVWDSTTSSNTYSCSKGYSVETIGAFTLSSKTKVTIKVTFDLSDSSYSGSGSYSLKDSAGTIDEVTSSTANSGINYSYEDVLDKGEYTILVKGGGGKGSSSGVSYCGYYMTCTVTFSKP